MSAQATALGLLSAVSTQAVAEQDTAPQAGTPVPSRERRNRRRTPIPLRHRARISATSPSTPAEEAARHRESRSGWRWKRASARSHPGQGRRHRTRGRQRQADGWRHEAEGQAGRLAGRVVRRHSNWLSGRHRPHDESGKPTYAVVAIDNDTTAVPYDTATSMVKRRQGGDEPGTSRRMRRA